MHMHLCMYVYVTMYSYIYTWICISIFKNIRIYTFEDIYLFIDTSISVYQSIPSVRPSVRPTVCVSVRVFLLNNDHIFLAETGWLPSNSQSGPEIPGDVAMFFSLVISSSGGGYLLVTWSTRWLSHG